MFPLLMLCLQSRFRPNSVKRSAQLTTACHDFLIYDVLGHIMS